MKKSIFIFTLLALTITSFSEEKKVAVKESQKIEINQSEKADYKKIRENWLEYLTGVPNKSNIAKMSKEELEETYLGNEKQADISYAKLNKNQDRTFLIEGYENMGDGVHVMRTYENIKNIAKAYATPNTKYYKNPEIKKELIEYLDWLYDNAYHEGLPENGNWWQWELGIPKHLNDIMVLLYDDIPYEKRMKYLKASQYFQPFAEYSGVSPSASYSTSPDKRVSTGGNRIDTSIISFLRGVLMEDKVQVIDGAKAVADVGEYVTTRDGFYKDGSFIQHGNVAYNGTYASVLFDGLGSVLWLATGTQFEVKDERIDNVYESILNGYKYLFINGGVNDSVSGRATSRDNSSDISRGKDLLTSLSLLSIGAGKEYQDEIKSLIKTVALENNSYNTIDKISNKIAKAIIRDIINDDSIKTLKVEGTKVYGAMDRAVSINEKGGKFVLSMHSSRIANYETMNNENVKGWYIGDGMTYVYGTDSETFTEYWPTVDRYHLPGVTNSLRERGDKSGERRGQTTSKAWVGGSCNGKETFVGMDMISWNKATEMRKSYFMTDDGAILIAASNINSKDGEVHTTIDNRIIKDGKIILNGKEIKEDTVIENPQNISLNFNENYKGENIGYKIVYAPQLNLKKETRTGSWKNIGGTSTEEITKDYFTAYINHGKNPKRSGFAYIILPMYTQEEVDNYDVSRFEIVKLDKEAHIIKDKKSGVTGINFWKDSPTKELGIKAYSTLSVLLKENDEFLELWVSDPTQLANYKSVLEVDGKYEVIESSTENIQATTSEEKIKIKIDLRNNGASEYIKLKKL
ncbi:polysaccharide lyase 8 family protein [uncultured Fusobacterium sp.]|uniref:polysaccharide lyase 8 family protein n=1 Tax=uncultured Fusobacterium sp. TaxID=159267 RepID=UPI0025CF8708|nr:polysaccharide lyase 8 family protein [uncultured Fusobacterium sp.]